MHTQIDDNRGINYGLSDDGAPQYLFIFCWARESVCDAKLQLDDNDRAEFTERTSSSIKIKIENIDRSFLILMSNLYFDNPVV